MLREHETVELHGLGEAISAAVEVSQYLVGTKYAAIQRVVTNMIQTSPSRKPEIVITLKRIKMPPARTEGVPMGDQQEDSVTAALNEEEEDDEEAGEEGDE